MRRILLAQKPIYIDEASSTMNNVGEVGFGRGVHADGGDEKTIVLVGGYYHEYLGHIRNTFRLPINILTNLTRQRLEKKHLDSRVVMRSSRPPRTRSHG